MSVTKLAGPYGNWARVCTGDESENGGCEFEFELEFELESKSDRAGTRVSWVEPSMGPHGCDMLTGGGSRLRETRLVCLALHCIALLCFAILLFPGQRTCAIERPWPFSVLLFFCGFLLVAMLL